MISDVRRHSRSERPRGKQGALQAGFTLIELLVTISVLAILLAIGVPYFGDVTLGSKLNSYANSLAASAYLARSEAIKRNAPVSLCAGASCPGAGAWENGWVVSAGGPPISVHTALPSGFSVASNVTSIDFQPTGVGATCALLTLTKSGNSQQRVVYISATGRPTVAKTTTLTCP